MLLSEKPDFVRLRHGNERVTGKNLVFFLRRRQEDAPGTGIRLGFSFSSKSVNAVQRNRLKRLLRETFKRLSTTAPYDIQVGLRSGVKGRSLVVDRGLEAISLECRVLAPRLL